jgi:hypothetical protein
LLWNGLKLVNKEANIMSEEKRLPEETKNISKLRNEILSKVVLMQESEGIEIELSEIDLDGVDGGWECSGCTSYKTTSAV